MWSSITTFLSSAFSWLWNCVSGIFSGQGTANEAGLGLPGAAGGGTNWMSVLGTGLGLAMLLNPTGTGHWLGKIGKSTAGAIGDTAGTVVDEVSDIANNLIKQPWFWVAAGVLLVWMLND